MPRTWASEVALASGGVALSVAAGALGAKLAGAVDRPELSAAIRRFVAAGISGAVAIMGAPRIFRLLLGSGGRGLRGGGRGGGGET